MNSAAVHDLAGQKFNRLQVIARAPKGRKGWLCRCECGAEKIVIGRHLETGSTKSCGCYARDRMSARNRTHSGTHSAEYRCWSSAKNRCFNPRGDDFNDYGGRGITMCDEWRDSFAAFLRDMGPRPSPAHQIDRIDTNGNYEPGNCRWATVQEQQSNRRSNVYVEINGERLTLKQAAHLHAAPGVRYHTVHDRMKRGMALHDALTRPLWERSRH